MTSDEGCLKQLFLTARKNIQSNISDGFSLSVDQSNIHIPFILYNCDLFRMTLSMSAPGTEPTFTPGNVICGLAAG